MLNVLKNNSWIFFALLCGEGSNAFPFLGMG